MQGAVGAALPPREAAWASGSPGPWVVGAWVLVALAILPRLLHYVPFAWPLPIEQLLGLGMRIQLAQLLLGFLAFPVLLAVSVGIVLLAALRWRRVLEVREGRLGTRPWALLWFTTMLYVHNVALALDPVLSALCWASLVALWPALLERLSFGRRWLRWLVAGAGIAAYLLAVGALEHPVERQLMTFWGLFVLVFAWLANRRTWLRDRLWVALVASVVVQFLFTDIPLREPTHGGWQIGHRDYAYNFCEIPERNALYASVPCDEGRRGCEQGFVAEHDTTDLGAAPVIHELLDSTIDGRIVHVECMGDEVWVGMAVTQDGQKERRENVMKFSVEDPSQRNQRMFDEPFGARFAHDVRHGVVYFIAEWEKRIRRLDLETGELDQRVSDAIYAERVGEGFGSHIIQNSSFHEERDSVFLVQWLSGSRIFEVDRERIELVQTLDPHHGGNHGIAVDEKLGRVWVTSVFGIDVLDIETGTLVWRKRLGLGTRLPVIDERNDRVYVTTTTGRVWVIDRTSPQILGSLAIGRGSRNAYVSTDGKRLYASAEGGYFTWLTDELRERFPDPGSRAGAR